MQHFDEASYDDTVNAICTHRSNLIFFITGERGIGKSAIAQSVAKKLEVPHFVIDCSQIEQDDLTLSMPIDGKLKSINHELIPCDKAAVILLDEYTKAEDEIQKKITPMLEPTNKRLGSKPLHPDTIVIMTGNKPEEGMGDNLANHVVDRIVMWEMGKPTHEKAIEIAIKLDFHPLLITFLERAVEAPMFFASCKDPEQKENFYIYHYSETDGEKRVSMRGLEYVSRALHKRDEHMKISAESFHRVMKGIIGEAAASLFKVYYKLADELPSRKEIINDPLGAKIPKDAAAKALLVYSAINWVDKKIINSFMSYLTRDEWSKEFQTLFIVRMFRHPNEEKQKIMQSHIISSGGETSSLQDWVAENHDLLTVSKNDQ
jgi:hypothetical protein